MSVAERVLVEMRVDAASVLALDGEGMGGYGEGGYGEGETAGGEEGGEEGWEKGWEEGWEKGAEEEAEEAWSACSGLEMFKCQFKCGFLGTFDDCEKHEESWACDGVEEGTWHEIEPLDREGSDREGSDRSDTDIGEDGEDGEDGGEGCASNVGYESWEPDAVGTLSHIRRMMREYSGYIGSESCKDPLVTIVCAERAVLKLQANYRRSRDNKVRNNTILQAVERQ
jgi:hypothetical protein